MIIKYLNSCDFSHKWQNLNDLKTSGLGMNMEMNFMKTSAVKGRIKNTFGSEVGGDKRHSEY